MGRTFKTWVYTADDGTNYNRKAPTDYTTQLDGGVNVKIGGTLAAAVNPNMDASFRPRVALCQDADGNKYRIICYENDAPLFLGSGMTFNIFDRDGGAAISVTQYGVEGERSRHKLLTP